MSPLPNDDDPEVLGERILARFQADGLKSLVLRPEIKEELALEARPAVHALLFGLGTDRAGDANSLEHHESLAMMTLLGRGLALQGATPTPVLQVVPLLFRAFRAEGIEASHELELALQSVCMEGFVRGREEAIERRLRLAHAQSIAPFLLVEGVVVLRLVGELSGEAIVHLVEELGRALFRADARACVVDVNALSSPTLRRARAVASADETARTLGVRCVFCGLDARWREALADTETELLTSVGTFPEAAALALKEAGYRVAKVGWMSGPLRGLLGN